MIDDVIATDPSSRSTHSVDDVMRPLDRVTVLDVDTSARDALEMIHAAEFEPVPVMQHGDLVGLIQRADVFRWMSLHELHR
ncbi:MAG: hypothetical protein U5O39_11635 [Gammaproteobacteria bacterium]|nr:hypothetical protein [Gammaproteobacteria bacterium]